MAGFTVLSPPGTGTIIDVSPGGPGAYIDFTTTIWERGPEILINTGGPDLGLNISYDEEGGTEEKGDGGEERGETPEEVLMPEGEPVGQPGRRPGVRLVPEDELDEIFRRLGGDPGDPSPRVVEPPGGGYVTRYPDSKTGGPAIHVNIPEIPIRSIHVV